MGWRESPTTSLGLEAALTPVRPSSLRESLMAEPGITWDDVGGLTAITKRLRDLIEQPLRDPDLFERLGYRRTSACCCTDHRAAARHCWPRRSRHTQGAFHPGPGRRAVLAVTG